VHGTKNTINIKTALKKKSQKREATPENCFTGGITDVFFFHFFAGERDPYM